MKTIRDLQNEREASPGPAWQVPDGEYSSGRVVVTARALRAMMLPALFGNLWDAKRVDIAIENAFINARRYAREHKAKRTESIPFIVELNMNNFVHLTATPRGSGDSSSMVIVVDAVPSAPSIAEQLARAPK